METLFNEIYRFEHDILTEQQRRDAVASIIAVIAWLTGYSWPEPPDAQNAPLSQLFTYINDVKVVCEYSEPAEGGGS